MIQLANAISSFSRLSRFRAQGASSVGYVHYLVPTTVTAADAAARSVGVTMKDGQCQKMGRCPHCVWDFEGVSMSSLQV